jgi:hypothetical protein
MGGEDRMLSLSVELASGRNNFTQHQLEAFNTRDGHFPLNDGTREKALKIPSPHTHTHLHIIKRELIVLNKR